MNADEEKSCSVKHKKFNKVPHLTKETRFPKVFKEVSHALAAIKRRKGNIKTVLHEGRCRGRVFQKVYALTFNVMKHLKIIDKIIEDVGLLIKEPSFNKECAEILIHEICFTENPLPGKSKPVLVIQKYQKDIVKIFSKYSSSSCEEKFDQLPRYARVNTLLVTVDKAISDLKELGFHQIEYESDISLEKYQVMVHQLRDMEFLVDFHFKDMLAFSVQQILYGLDLYKYGHIFLHDKSSYIPVHLLAPPPGSIVFDSCAAPGMKTAHLAARMNNSGKIFATDSDTKRFSTLKSAMKHGGVKICKTMCKDFLEVDGKSEAYSSVEFILLDPSCSGSGMVNRMNDVTDNCESRSEDRLKKLAGFQILLLKHALSFPNVKRVVYSTCSIHEEENEYVVHEALQHYSKVFEIVPALPDWPEHGIGDYKYAHLCLRASPEISLTNGFFVAVFERTVPS